MKIDSARLGCLLKAFYACNHKWRIIGGVPFAVFNLKQLKHSGRADWSYIATGRIREYDFNHIAER